MRTWKSRAALFAVAVVVLSSPAIAAQASPSRSTPHQKLQVTGVNDLLNADLVFEVVEDSGLAFGAEGHLTLKPYKGTTYHGTFVDNMGAEKSYTVTATGVSATSDDGVYVIKTHAGTFTIHNTDAASTTTAPSKFGKGLETDWYTKPHAYTTGSPLSVTIASRFGSYAPPVNGVLTLTTDAWGYIAPYSSKQKTKSSFVYTIGTSTHKYTSHVTSTGQYTAPNCAGGGSLLATIPQGKVAWHVNASELDGAVGGGCPLVSNAYSGSGASFTEGNFEGKLNFT